MTTSIGPEDQASGEAHAWLARLKGDPTELDRTEFERWYGASAAHRQAYDRIAEDWISRYSRIAQTEFGRSRSGLPPRPSRRGPIGYAAAIASLAALLAAGLLLWRPGFEPVAQAGIIATAIGEIRTITLPDDRQVTLDTASRVAVRFSSRERHLEVQQGRARLSVRGSEKPPFVVEAGGGEIVGQQTVFDVSVAGRGATVALLEGEAEVQPSRAAGTGASRRTLNAGERVLLAADGRIQGIKSASDAELGWPSGMLEFLDTRLDQAIAEANRYSMRPIRITDPHIAGLRVTGTFRAGDTAGLARSLATAFSLTLEDVGGREILLRARG